MELLNRIQSAKTAAAEQVVVNHVQALGLGTMAPANDCTEVIAWFFVTDQMPDADTTVLLSTPDADEPVQLGWYDGEGIWLGEPHGRLITGVVAWARIPTGPATRI